MNQMIQTFKNAWKIADIRKKLLFTLFIVLIYRVGAAIPVPYINTEYLQSYIAAHSGTIFGLLNTLSGSALSRATLFALSIQPYINASIIIQLLTIAIPALERLAKDGGEDGKKKIQSITRYTTLGIGLLQGFGYYTLIRSYGLLNNESVWAAIVIVMSFTAGAVFLMWLGEQINDRGIGNGISLLIFGGIVARIPSGVRSISTLYGDGGISLVTIILFVIAAVLVTAGVVLIQEGQRRIPVQYAKRVVGRKMYGRQSTHIPIKVNQAGVIPIIFALSLLQFPLTITYFLSQDNGFSVWVMKWLSPSGNPGVWIYGVLNVILIIFFTYFYTGITFNPNEVANNMKANGGFIPGIRPGKATEDYLNKVMSRVTIVGAIFLALIATLPTIISVMVPALKGIHFGGTSLLIAVGVALDTVRQLENQMLMRNYQGFLK